MDFDERIIEEVRGHQILYDLGHTEYKNLKKKEYAWREVAAAVGVTEEECRKRWRGLRDSYKRCKRAEQIASGSAAKKPRKSWRYFEALSFLDNVTSCRSTIGNLSDSFHSEDYVVESLEDSGEEVCPTMSSAIARQTKATDINKLTNFLELAASSVAEACETFAASQKKNDQDATDLFFAGLAAKVKAANLPPTAMNRLESKVAALVCQEIAAHLQSSSDM